MHQVIRNQTVFRGARSLVHSIVILMLLGCTPLFAQGTGTVSGRVIDSATGLALAGARVSVAGAETFAGQSGEFVVTGVPAGEHPATVSYVGYTPQTRSVSVPAGGSARLDVAFNSDVTVMNPIVVEGAAVGSARAINQQLAADTLTTIVAADEIGRFPDQNAAESLQRLPGVSLYRDQGEGRFINLRGLNYIYTSVRLNGASLASSELGDRATALDVIASDSVAALEVSKAPTPDKDAEGLSGSINIRTRSAFEAVDREATFALSGIYTSLTGRTNPKVSASFSSLFGDGSAGVSASVTWQERDFGSRNYEEDGWSLRSAGGGAPTFFVPDALGFRDYVINRERLGANAAFELRPSPATHVYLRGTFSRFTDTEDRHQLYIPFSRGTLTAAGATSGALDNISRVRRDLRIRRKDQEVRAISTGFDHKGSAWELDGQLGWSQGLERRPGEMTVRFRRNASDSDITYAFTGLYSLGLEQTGGASIADPANYTALDRLELVNSRGVETERNVALNVRYNVAGTPAYVKAGAMFRLKDKDSAIDISRFTAPATFTFASLAEGVNADYPFGIAVPRISHDRFLAAFNGNRGAFTESVLQPDSTLDDWHTRERVRSAYIMGGTRIGRIGLIAGVRHEDTAFDTNGAEIRGTTIAPTRATRSYDNVLPGVHVRYDISPRLVARLSYSGAIVRPAFGETNMARNVADTDTEVTAGNPDLATLESQNLDASLEYYMPSLGLLSASVFRKEIENFSYAITVPGGDPAFPAYDLITYANGSSGTITGLEFGYQQRLRFLPAPFDGLGVAANATFADSEAAYPTRPGEELPFIGQSDVSGNMALTYEKGRLFLRAALNWRDKRLREDEPIGADSDGDRWVDDHRQLDLSGSYRVRSNLEVFAEASNVTNEPFRVHFNSSNGQGRRFVQLEEYDWTANFGVRLSY